MVSGEQWAVVTKQATLTLLMVTLFGVLGGLIVPLIQPVRYQAQAYIAVYAMPQGLNGLIGPDEANQVDSIYQTGAMENLVLEQAHAKLPAYSIEVIKQSIQVEIVAYTPYTRVTATAPTAHDAAALANAVASAWVGVAAYMYGQAYDATRTVLEGHKTDLSQRIALAQHLLAAAKPSSHSAAALRSELQSLQDSRSQVDKALLGLDVANEDIPGNAYVEVTARQSSAIRTPDPARSLASGTIIGIALGLVLAIWLTMRRWNQPAVPSQSPLTRAMLPITASEAAHAE